MPTPTQLRQALAIRYGFGQHARFETIKKALSRYVHAGASIQKVKQTMQQLYDVRDNVRERGKLHRRLEKDVRSTRARQAAQTRRREAVVMPSETQ